MRSPVTLSVVVPVWNVERYLVPCLHSILRQSLSDLEVIVVDDGSTDRSGEIADRFAAADDRVRVIHQDNAGLGAARQSGISRAVGQYLAFADSDDVVCPGAYEKLVRSLELTGSDLAIGSAHRLEGHKTSVPPLMRENHRRDRHGVRLDDAPLLLADCFAWNKAFRRDFWDENGLSFPTGLRYEDQPTLTQALLAAASIDVLAAPVYLWRIRTDGSSISQQRGDLRDLQDRLVTKRWATSYVDEQASRGVRETWYRRVLPIDLPEYFRHLPTCSPQYFDLLSAMLAEFWGSGPMAVADLALPKWQRAVAAEVLAGRREAALAVLVDRALRKAA